MIQQALTNRVIQLISREPRKSDLLIDELNHRWVYDGENWNDIGVSVWQTITQGYGTKLQQGILSVDTNIVALKNDVLDTSITINGNENIRQIQFNGVVLQIDSQNENKLNITIQNKSDIVRQQLSNIAFSGDYNDLINKPELITLKPTSNTTLGGVIVDNKTIIADEYGNIHVPKASITQEGLVKLNIDKLGQSNETVPTSYAVRQALTQVKSHSSYLYIAYADDQNGLNWQINQPLKSNGQFKQYRSQFVSQYPITDFTKDMFDQNGWVKYVGNDSYLYIAYAQDDKGNGFSLTPSRQTPYAGFLTSYKYIEEENLQEIFKEKDVKWVRFIGENSYSYIAYALDDKGNGFSLTPTDELKYRAQLVSDYQISQPKQSDFINVPWVKYSGQDVYLYIAYANDEIGNGFDVVPSNTKKYIAVLIKNQPITHELTLDDFQGVIWTKYIGKDSYLYIAYAMDQKGNNFSLIPTDELKYRAQLHSDIQIKDISIDYFSDCNWVKYIGDNAYIKYGYAQDDKGNGFSLIPNKSKKYLSQIVLYEDREVLIDDFKDSVWVKYIGEDTYTYVGYALDDKGNGFSLIPNNQLIYRKEIHSAIQLTPTYEDFEGGEWIQIVPQISIGNVISGEQALITNVGTNLNPILDITLPRGQDGIGINPQGLYSESIHYSMNDVVRFGKYLWRCKVQQSNISPPMQEGITSNENWDMWLQDGKTPDVLIGEVRVSEDFVPKVINSGTSTNVILDFQLVSGKSGKLEINQVYTGNPGTDVIIDNIGTESEAKLNITIPRGNNGYYFKPLIDQDGNLSWENDGLLQNPPTVNIKGQEGIAAGFGNPTASINMLKPQQQPQVIINASGQNVEKIFDFQFNIPRGQKGFTGDSAGFDKPQIILNTLKYGDTPSVNITSSGENTNKKFVFQFSLPQGKPGQALQNQSEKITNSENNYIFVSKNKGFPVWIKTSLNNLYPIQKRSMTISQQNYCIYIAPYLAYDNVSQFAGQWEVYFAGGLNKMNIVMSQQQPQNPVDGMIWIQQ